MQANENESNIEEKRFSICEKCGIYNVGKNMCNSSLYINPETNQVSDVFKKGYIKGCGCYIPTKIKKDYNHCPAHKW